MKRVLTAFLWLAVVEVALTGSPLLAQNKEPDSQPSAQNNAPAISRDVAKEATRRYKIGVQQGLAGRYSEAAESFRQSIALNPQRPDAHFGLGHAYFDLGRWAEAAEELKTAVRLNPKDADAYHMMGLAYSKLGDYAQAAQAFQRTVLIKSDWARAYYDLGNASFKLGDFSAAIRHYAKVTALKPSDPEAYNDLGAAYGEVGRYGEAFSSIMMAVKLRPSFAAAHNNLGLIHYRQGRYAEAADAFRVALRHEPNDSLIRNNLELAAFALNGRNGESSSAAAQAQPGSSNARQGNWIVRSALDAEQTKGGPSSLRTLIASNGQGNVPLNADYKLAQPTEENRIEEDPAKDMGMPAKPISAPAVAANASTAPPIRQPPISAPTSSEPVSPTSIYRVGPGDMLDIRVLSRPSNSSTLFTILAGGLLEYPLAEEPLMVAGMTTDEIDARLTAELERRAVVSDPEVIVSVREYGSHIVIISGLVADPGSKVIRREAIPLYVVLADAQPAPEAGQVEVTSHRTNEQSVIDLADQSAMNMLVYPGDVLKVSARPTQFYYIGGNVTGPGQKQFHAKLTLTQAILAAGGSIQAGKGEVRVTREGQDGRLTTIKYNLREIMSGALPDPMVKAGDRVELVK